MNTRKLTTYIKRQAKSTYVLLPYRRVRRVANKLLHRFWGLLRKFDYRRPVHLALAGLILLSVAAPVVQKLLEINRYELTNLTKALLTKSDPVLTAKIKLDEKGETYRFNQEEVKNQKANPDQQSKTIGQGVSEKSKVVYGFDASKDIEKGVTLTDINSQISFKMIPLLNARDGELVDGHIVYPLKDKPAQLIYTPEGAGLKEDLVLAKEMGDDLEFSYRLELNGTLEAKLLPNGSIGIYSGNPALFGNISFGSDADREKVEKARETADKDYLQFVIPAPIIKQSGSDNPTAQAEFLLKGDLLTVKAQKLKDLRYPVTIDPSTFTTSGSSFGSGNNEGGLDTGSSLTRRMSGAGIGSWGINSFTLPRYGHATVATTVGGNSYLYVLGGCTNQGCSTAIANVSYASINNVTGAIGEWTSSPNSFNIARWGLTAVANNGYLYVLGGCSTSFCNGERNDVQFIQINSNGSLTTPSTCTPPSGQSWCTTTSFATARHEHTSVVVTVGVDTYVYVIGGCSVMTNRVCNVSTGFRNDVQLAKFNANGTLGLWSSTTNIVGTGRFGHANASYVAGGNNYVSLVGGRANGACFSGGPNDQCNDFQFAQVQSDGTLSGGWTQNTTNVMTSTRYSPMSVIRNGYVFAGGGCSSGPPCANDAQLNSIEAAPIGSDGNLSGGWAAKTSFKGGRLLFGGVNNGDILYITGGNGNVTQCQGGTHDSCDDVQYTKIDGSGNLISPTCINGNPIWCGSLDLPEGRDGFASFTYTAPTSGTTYIYVVGGVTTGGVACGASNLCNDVIYAPILSNGSVGSWQKLSSTFRFGRKWHTSLVYNGNIYVIGGETSGGVACGASNMCNDVQYASLNAVDGSIGAWVTTAPFTTGRRSFGASAFNGYLYVLGGYTGSSALSDVQYAKFNPDGTIPTSGSSGTWTTGTAMPVARSSFPAMAYNGYLYVVGGCMAACSASGDYRDDILKTSLNDSGSNSGWVTACSDCYGSGIKRANAASTIYNGVMYVAGGFDISNIHSDVRVSSIGADGSIDKFTPETSMNSGRYGMGLIAHKSKLYTIGGCRTRPYPCSSPVSQVKFAAIDILGSTGNYTAGPVLPVSPDPGNYDHGSVVYNGIIYVAGGCTEDTNLNQGDDCLRSTTKVQRATIGSDGSVGAWQSSDYTTLLIDAISRHATVAHKGYLYMLGGMTNNSTGGAYVNTVRYSKINSDGSLVSNPFLTTVSLPAGAGLGLMKAAVYNNYMYVFGGCNANEDFGNLIGECLGGSKIGAVYSAAINADGTLGAWNKDWNGVNERMNVTSKVNYGLAVAGKYVYITAGENSSAVWLSSFNGAGGLTGDFVAAGPNSNLPSGTKGQPSFEHNGNLYSGVGGPGGYGGDLYTTPINFSDGSIGPWTKITTSGYADFRGSGVAYGGRVYYMGGMSFAGQPSGTAVDDVRYATIYNGGSGHVSGSGTWNTGSALPNARSHHATVALDGYLYVIGGQTTASACSGNICNNVLKAPINSDGTLGSWVADSTFATARRDHSAAVYEAAGGEKYIYITGGCATTSTDCTGSFLGDVQFAHVKNDGSGGLENWTPTTAFTAPARYSHTTSIYKDFIYVVGGCSVTNASDCTTAQSNVQKAKLNIDGTIPVSGGNAWTATTGLPAARYAHSTTIYNGRMYVIGGRQTSFCQTNPDTISCTQLYLGKINNDGTITDWPVIAHLQLPLYGHASVAANGYLYVIGGGTISEVLENKTYYASLHQDGSIGYWSKSLDLATATNYLSGVYSDGYLYAIGGTAASTTVNYGGQQAPARVGRYSILHKAPSIGNSLLDFCGGTNTEGFNFVGTIPDNSTLELQYRLTGLNNSWRGKTLMESGILPNVGYDLSGSGRAIFATLLIDDSKSATFPETSTQQSIITEVEFNYRHSHPRPANRLRHGAFFTGEEKEVLDTNPVKPQPDANNFCSSI